LSVTRSKAAAGRQTKRHICPLLSGLTDGWERRCRDALPLVAGRARSLRKAHFNAYHKILMTVCGIQEDGTAIKYALFRAQNGARGVKNSLMHHLLSPA